MSGQRLEDRYAWIIAIDDEQTRVRELSRLLEQAGFSYGSRSATNLLLLSEKIAPNNLVKISLASLQTASPDMALNSFERLVGAISTDELEILLASRRRLGQCLILCGASPFLTNLICRKPDHFSRLFIKNELKQSRNVTEMLVLLDQMTSDDADLAGLMKGLRQFKQFEILRIATRDLCGLAALEETMLDLSALAEVTLQKAINVCHNLLVKEHGQPLRNMEDGHSQAAMTILGMGKLGGQELNFSSDIDLIYFYESDQGATSGIDDGRGNKKGIISLHSFFNKQAELITKAMNQVTEDGFVFRVDLGLRPEGTSGDLAISVRSAEIYYESWGQPWERAAMLKARPVAGSLELGNNLLTALTPFIYRRYLDYTLIEDMKLMKQKIDASLARSRGGEVNLKLGHGGIREIEFFIQTLQLVYSGKQPHLRERNSLKALQLLAKAKLISVEDCQKLTDAYCFLRTAEHRIQVVQERQTHDLPTKPDEQLALARRCGFLREDSLPRFLAALENHRSHVASLFGGLFHSQDEQSRDEVDPEIMYLLDNKADSDLVKDILEERQLEDVERAYENLSVLRNGPTKGHMTERNRRIHTRITPLLLQAMLEAPDPDMALAHAERFISAISGRLACYSLLAESMEAVRSLATLFGTTTFLSKILISHPEQLEAMLTQSYLNGLKPQQVMQKELDSLLDLAQDFEEQLDLLRSYRNEEFLRIGMGDINGHLTQGCIAMQLTALAEVCLGAAYRLALSELTRFGQPLCQVEGQSVMANLAIIGMGKLGGRELNYHSDLDIIFIYDYQGQTDGSKQISNHEYFAKLAQKLIMVLSTTTREGIVYKLDTRLRPSGNAGPLVTSLTAFENYHREDAQIWERQALSKARVVFGDKQLADNISAALQQAVYGTGLDHAGRMEIHRLRMRMEQEIAKEKRGSYNIKTGRGGMVDVEFIAQCLQLSHGVNQPCLQLTRTIDLLMNASKLELLSAEDADTLINGYKFLRKLENRLRLIHDHSINDLSGDQRYLDKLAKRLGYDNKLRHPGQQLMQDYAATTEGVRAVYDRILGG